MNSLVLKYEYFDDYNGNLKAYGYYFNGLKHGCWEYYDEEGYKTKLISFKNGLYHGLFLTYYPKGSLKTMVTYKNGIIRGIINLKNFKPNKIQYVCKNYNVINNLFKTPKNKFIL